MLTYIIGIYLYVCIRHKYAHINTTGVYVRCRYTYMYTIEVCV